MHTLAPPRMEGLAAPPAPMGVYQPTEAFNGAAIPNMSGAIVESAHPLSRTDAAPHADPMAGKGGVYISANRYAPEDFEPTPHYQTMKLPEAAIYHEDVKLLPVALGNVAMRGVAVLAEANYAEEARESRGRIFAYHQAEQHNWRSAMAQTEAERAKKPAAEEAAKAPPSITKPLKEKAVFDRTIKVEDIDGLSIADQELVRHLRVVLESNEADSAAKVVAKAMLEDLDKKRRDTLRKRLTLVS